MKIRKFHVYLADLNPQFGTEAGKTRPVVVLQTDLLNEIHPSTIICPVTSQVVRQSSVLRVHLSGKECGLSKESDILVDQIRAIDNRRFKKEIGVLSVAHKEKLLENIRLIVLDS